MDTVKVWRALLLDAISKVHICYRRIPADGRRYFIKNAEKRAFFSSRRAFDKGRRRRVEKGEARTRLNVYNDCTRFWGGVPRVERKKGGFLGK